MKKLVSIFLLCSLVVPVAGVYIWLEFEKNHVRKEVKRQMIEGMVKEELVLLKFTKAGAKTQLKWEHSKEFEYKGQMYDVVETRVEGETISYLCWWDNEETKLNKDLCNLVSEALGNNPQNREKNKRLGDFFKSLYYTDILGWSEPYLLPGNTPLKNHSVGHKSYYIRPPVPPPQLA